MSNELPIQIDYTSRDYESILSDLRSLVNLRTNNAWAADDPSDLGTVLLESFAYMGDIMSYYIDRVANELSIDTATRRKTLVNLGLLYGYRVSGPTPATMEITFENISTTNIDIPVGTQNGETICVSGKGMPSGAGFGDLYVRVTVKASVEEKKALETHKDVLRGMF